MGSSLLLSTNFYLLKETLALELAVKALAEIYFNASILGGGRLVGNRERGTASLVPSFGSIDNAEYGLHLSFHLLRERFVHELAPQALVGTYWTTTVCGK